MSGQAGRDVLIRLGDGASPEGFVTVAGIRTKTFNLKSPAADATAADSPEGWREMIAGAGVKSVSVKGAGVFKDGASDARLRQVFFAGEAVTAELVVPDFGRLSGPFIVDELKYGGSHDGEATMELALESAGLIGFAEIV